MLLIHETAVSMQRTAFTGGAELKINTTRRDSLDDAIKSDQVIRQVVKNGGTKLSPR